MSKKQQKIITDYCVQMVSRAIVIDMQKKGAGYKWLNKEVAKMDKIRKDSVISQEVDRILKLK
jgi:hypothetical protein